MSVTVTVTNTTDAVVNIPELYAQLAASGAAGSSLTFTRSMAEMDMLIGLKTLVSAGTVTVDMDPSSDNLPGPGVPQMQFGTSTAMSVASIAIVTQAVTFQMAYDASVTPNVQLTVVEGSATDFKANVYVRSLTHTGFTIALDVTTAGAGGHTCTVSWKSTY